MRALSVKRTGYLLSVPILAAVVAAVLGASASSPGSTAWPTAGHDLGNTRDATAEHAIGPGNASRLAPAWSVTTAGTVEATPAVYGGDVYFPDGGGKLWAVSAADGRVLWSRTISSYTGKKADIARVSPAVSGDDLVLGGTDFGGGGAWVLGVDRHTGQLRWRTEVDDQQAAIITSSAVVYRGVAYLGVSSDEEDMAAQPGYRCCSFRGSVVAVNAATGTLLWQTRMVPAGYTGGPVWDSTPAIDPGDHLLYVGTGNNYTAPHGVCVQPGQKGCTPPSADDHADSVVALDLTTGSIRWYRSTLSSDVFTQACTMVCGPDFDFGSGPNLIRLPSGGELVGIGQKSGVYWALDPLTGAIVWHTQVGPGGALGGIELGSATDGRHIFVAIGDSNVVPYRITSASGTVTTASGGSWAALDAATGKVLWQVADPTQAADMGYVTLANGVVYAGSTVDHGDAMYALDAADGQILWRFDSGSPVHGGAAPVGATVYWGSGSTFATRCPKGDGAIHLCNGYGDKLFAFRTR